MRQVHAAKYHTSFTWPPLAAVWMLKPAVGDKDYKTGELKKKFRGSVKNAHFEYAY